MPLVCFAANLFLFPASVRGQDRPPIGVENIRVGLENTSKAGAWTPVRVDLRAGAERFSGWIEVGTPDEDGTPVVYRAPVVVDPDGVGTTVAYVRPGSIGSDITVRVLDVRGRAKTSPLRPEDLRGGVPPVLLDPGQTLIVVLGNAQGIAEVPAIVGGQSAVAGSMPGPTRETELVVVKSGAREGLPGRWYGLDAVGAIVLDTNDHALMDALRTRGEVLRQWVRNGGHLVLAVAANWQETRERLGDLLPAELTGTTPMNDLGALETFAGSTSNPIPASVLIVAKLANAEAHGGRVLAASAATPLVVRGSYGFGRVTLVGVDADQRPLADWKDKSLLWARVLDLRAQGRGEPQVVSVGGPAPGSFFQNNVRDLANLLHVTLDRPPGVTLVPFGWVAFFVFLYILLIGPGDYLFLRKVVKRMELTWITFPLVVVAVGAAAYAAAYALKGTDLKVVKVDVVDVDQPSGRLRGRSWIALFSPQNRDYGVTVVPVPLEREAEALAPAGARPPAGTDRLVSWFAPTAPRFGGGSSRLNLIDRGYAYDPPATADAVRGVRIPIWSTKSFSARWSGPAGDPLIDADLVPLGSDRLDGSISNLTDRPLANAVLYFGDQVYDQLGTIAPGASVRISSSSRTRPLAGYLQERANQFLNPDGQYIAHPGPDGKPNPALLDLLRTLLFRDGMNPRTPAPPSPSLRDLDLTGQLALERPILVADLAGPAAALALDGAPGSPVIQQTTVLRIILPLKK